MSESGSTSPRRRVALSGIAVGIALLSAGSAVADHRGCEDWRRPYVTELEVWVGTSDRRGGEEVGRDGIRLEPRARVDVAVIGRDQKGDRFPDDRLPLGLEVSQDCDRLITVRENGKTGLRIEAGERAGTCSFAVYLPGNENVERRIDVNVGAERRSDDGGFSPFGHAKPRDAEFMAKCLYQAILRREADPEGLKLATDQVADGKTEKLIDAMFNSKEFRDRSGARSSEEMLEQFYQGILGRPADRGGRYTYLPQVKKGAYKEVLIKLISSDEYRKRRDQ